MAGARIRTLLATTAPAATILIRRHAPAPKPCHRDRVPLDVDVSPWDNSGTKKEGVACTYKLHDGYAPIFAHLGQEGDLVDGELRPGDQHGQRDTPEFLDRAIPLARRVTDAKLLVRMDAGHDDEENRRRLRKNKVDWIIKRNLHRESEGEWLEEAQAHGDGEEPRPGKEVYTGQMWGDRDGRAQRVGFRVARRMSLWRDNPWRFVWQRVHDRFTQPAALATRPSP